MMLRIRQVAEKSEERFLEVTFLFLFLVSTLALKEAILKGLRQLQSTRP
jgi:hypothetical protein